MRGLFTAHALFIIHEKVVPAGRKKSCPYLNMSIGVQMDYIESFTGRGLRYRFQYPDTAKYMSSYIRSSEETGYDIQAPFDYMERQKPWFPESTEDAYVEYKSLIGLTSLTLLEHGSCLFHASAFLWRGYAWLLTGPSGVGKTTQYKNWKKTHREKVSMICGDMPLLTSKEDGTFWVSPSPWNGKERIRGKEGAPLGGFILLEQSDSNSIRRISPEESAISIFQQFAVRPWTMQQVHDLTALETELIKKYPVWKLENLGDYESMRITQETIDTYLNRLKKAENGETTEQKNKLEKDTHNKEKTGIWKSDGQETVQSGLRIREGVVLSQICNYPVLISLQELEGEVPYISQINETTADIWKLIQQGMDEPRICRTISQIYDVEEPETIREDLHVLLKSMAACGYLAV